MISTLTCAARSCKKRTLSRMSLTDEHLTLASKIDMRVRELERAGANEAVMLGEMLDQMPNFKRLMDTTTLAEMDDLCDRFHGFYRYAKLLERMAEGISSGRIKIPE